MSRSDVASGTARDLVASGEAVLETEQGLVFVPGVLPGERALVRLLPKKGRVRRGHLLRVEVEAPERVAPPCAHASRCGGCPMMHASLSLQRAKKLAFLRAALTKAGVHADLPIASLEAADTLGYRRRARLSFCAHGAGVDIGFKRERSGTVVTVDACAVLVPVLSDALADVRDALAPSLVGQGEIQLALGQAHRPVAVIRTDEPQPQRLYAACERLVDERGFAGVALFAAGASAPATFGDPTERGVGVDGAPLRGTVGGFSQAHLGMNDTLARAVVELAQTSEARVLELYAGHGNLSVALAPGAAHYTAVEQDPAAVEAARENLSARAIPAKLVVADATQYPAKGALDVLVLDPPRGGAPGVLARFAQRKPKRIVYVSCDPATLGRDLGEALGAGYRVARALCVEMFPHTAELESVVLLTR